MPAKKKAAESTDAPVFDISQFREEKRYVWRDIEREDGKPLRVKLQDLSIRQTNEIPWGMKTTLKESMEVCSQYIAEWDFEAENIETGEKVPVPPPAEVGWHVTELLPNKVTSDLINWLKIPHFMRSEEEKKSRAAEEGKQSASKASSSTSEKSSGEN